MGYYRNENGKLQILTDGEKIWIEPWGENSLRVRSVRMGEILDTDFALLPPKPCTAEIEIGEETASITNGKIKAVIELDDWRRTHRIGFYNQKGELLLKEISNGGALARFPRYFKPITGGDFELTASFDSNPDEKLYGMGQYQQAIFDIKNCNFELAHRNSQASVPFVLSSLGYGFFWHNPAIGRVSFGKNTTEWYAQSTKQLDYWITAGDTPAEIEEAYAEATGKVPMMPEYGMGFWQCKLRYWNQEQVLKVAREYKRRNIPVDVIVVDFFHWPHMGDYRFDEEFFPDPEAMARELHEMGMKLMVSVWPQVALTSENYREMLDKGLLVRAEKGAPVGMQFVEDSMFFDATNPEARKYVWEKCKKNYYDKGIDLFWLDEAEPEYGVYDFDNYRYYMGPNAQVGNVYPQRFSRGFYEGMKAEGEDKIVNLVRCAWAGSQRYGALVWSGDVHSTYEDFRRQICAGLHMGIAGIPWWTTDIGGFINGNIYEDDFKELLVRWFQYGAFSPVMRLHGDRDPHNERVFRKDGTEMLWTGADNEIWSFGEKVCEILEKYIRLREKMRPYIRTLMEEAHEKGSPVMRTLFYEFPQDSACWDVQDQYMFGSDILVAPVVYEHASQRDVYLPAGASWTNMHTGETFQGGQTVSVDAPLDVIPAFLRDGSHEDLIGQI